MTKAAMCLSLLLLLGCETVAETIEPVTEAVMVEEDAAPNIEPVPEFEYDTERAIPATIDARDQVRRLRRSRPAPPVDFGELIPAAVTEDMLHDALVLGLLRVGATEVEFQNDRDVIGFWQIANAIRAGHCDTNRFATARATISQCRTASGRILRVAPGEAIEGAEETLWSALRRLSPNVLDNGRTARNWRQVWARTLQLGCDQPPSYRPSTLHCRADDTECHERSWRGLTDDCIAIELVARRLVRGEQMSVTGGATPIAWGGRCEEQGGACDDRLACQRGLARIPNTGTANALWCRAGTRGCPDAVVHDGIAYSDEVCLGLRIPAPARVQERVAPGVETAENGQSNHQGEADEERRDPRRVRAVERDREVAAQPEEA